MIHFGTYHDELTYQCGDHDPKGTNQEAGFTSQCISGDNRDKDGTGKKQVIDGSTNKRSFTRIIMMTHDDQHEHGYHHHMTGTTTHQSITPSTTSYTAYLNELGILRARNIKIQPATRNASL